MTTEFKNKSIFELLFIYCLFLLLLFYIIKLIIDIIDGGIILYESIRIES